MFFLDSKVDEERFLQLYAAFLSLNREYKTVESKLLRRLYRRNWQLYANCPQKRYCDE